MTDRLEGECFGGPYDGERHAKPFDKPVFPLWEIDPPVDGVVYPRRIGVYSYEDGRWVWHDAAHTKDCPF